jgi:poly-gamma-glutamate synthesis protein (capsule biosynthesis protein)
MVRRSFLGLSLRLLLGALAAPVAARAAQEPRPGRLRLFLAGDVMTGRGLDQALATSVDPELREPWVRDARRYLELARTASGPFATPLSPETPWGDALQELAAARPDVRIVNLETAVTTSDHFWPDKGIHYRMHPDNVAVLRSAELDLVVLANNHAMDFGRPGLRETLAVLRDAGIGTVGAGPDRDAATAPAVLDPPPGRLIVLAYGAWDAGVPRGWAAGASRSGLAYLDDVDAARADAVAEVARAVRRTGDRVIVSLHWGGNWGYEVPPGHRAFAHRLIEAGGADVVFGHSSHHPKGIEVHRDRLILYGAGDLLNDYEGIGGHESYRPELSLLYLPTLGPDGRLAELRMVPMRIRRLRLERARGEAVAWLAATLDRVSRPFGTGVARTDDDALRLVPA